MGILTVVGVLVLLLTCSNVANLFLSRAATREQLQQAAFLEQQQVGILREQAHRLKCHSAREAGHAIRV